MPVAVTSASARPRVTTVFMKTMLQAVAPAASSSADGCRRLAHRVRFAGQRGFVHFGGMGVQARRPSAGMRSPASSSTMSPGTSCAGVESSLTRPSRRTRAVRRQHVLQRRQGGSARCSW